MELTIEQITQAVTAKPELKTALLGSLKNDVLEGMKAEGVTFRTKDEETTFLSNYEANVVPAKVQAEIGGKIKEVHDRYDNDLFDLLGEKKGPTEKTYDFLKRALTALQAKKAGGNDSKVLQDQIAELTNKLNERKDYVAPDEVEKIKSSYFGKEINLKISNSLAGKAIAVPAHITDEKAKAAYIDQQKGFIAQAFLSKYKAKQDDKGNVLYYDGETLLTDTKTAAPLTEAQLIEKDFQFYFVPEKPATGGAGSGKGGDGKVVDVNEATLKTKQDVHDYLKLKLEPKGISLGSQEYTKEYTRIITDYGITG